MHLVVFLGKTPYSNSCCFVEVLLVEKRCDDNMGAPEADLKITCCTLVVAISATC